MIIKQLKDIKNGSKRSRGYIHPSCSDISNFVFLDIGLLLTKNLLKQGFIIVKCRSSLRKFYNTYQNFSHPLQNICAIDDNGFGPMVVTHHSLFSSIVTSPMLQITDVYLP